MGSDPEKRRVWDEPALAESQEDEIRDSKGRRCWNIGPDLCERARCDLPFLGSSEIPLLSFLFLTFLDIPFVLVVTI